MCEVLQDDHVRISQKGVVIRRTPSVYGGAGGRGVRISTCYGVKGSSFDMTSVLRSDLGVGLYYDEKSTMQNLNERLATYLERVRSLEKANGELEVKIKEWYSQRIITSVDYTHYQVTIEDLFRKIRIASQANARVVLDIDNSRLAADDFRQKYEAEMAVYQSVLADNASLKTLLDQLTLSRSDLEMQIERLREEIAYLKKDHLEEMALLRIQVKDSLVKVEVDSAPQEDLGKILEEMRAQYEATIIKNTKEIELWFRTKMGELNPNGYDWNTELDKLRIELSLLKRSLQKLEIDLQSSLSLKASLEVSLQETQSRWSIQLSQYQSIIGVLEVDIHQVHLDIERQRSEYKMLLDIKTRLELEIAEYRRLLDGNATQQKTEILVLHEPQVTKRVRTIEEVIVDGKVVSREEDVEVSEGVLQS